MYAKNYATKMMISAAALVGLAMLASSAQAADPTGIWKWSRTFNDRTIEYSLKLDLDGEKLKGTLIRGEEVVDIEGAIFKGNELGFSVNRERGGRKFTVRYKGVMIDDLIAGKVTYTDRDGEPHEVDWAAKRVKE